MRGYLCAGNGEVLVLMNRAGWVLSRRTERLRWMLLLDAGFLKLHQTTTTDPTP
jgi:hypothetical protein